jgi:hypothetical protein
MSARIDYHVIATPVDPTPELENPQPAIEIGPWEGEVSEEFASTDDAHDAVMDTIRAEEEHLREMRHLADAYGRAAQATSERLAGLRQLERDLVPHL